MFKRLLALMMVLSVFTVHANVGAKDGLKAAFDELNYSLTVEWDQKDKSFYDAQMKGFISTLNGLQSKGLTNAQLIEFVKSEVKNDKIARDLETVFNLVTVTKMNSTEASKYMVDTMKKSYSVGASWNGEVFLYMAVGVLLVGAIVAIALAGGSSSSGSNNGGYYCTDYYVCDTNCYYDGWGYYTCYDSCYWTCY